ncbi:hypothetical protein [Paracoccus sp. IB05]|uniref:hypothetical protein n=1 Tax=Paracoccus sp. IB05 TaxID=2779367 RepID=UPI0018E80700|nr:hypothetical protein [Paracoccus sp. IB05]MBJ2149716.1 hypothetical protein [Paracoccus sp. IB05]
MAIITTKRNTVYACEPLPDDSFVQICLGRPAGRNLLGTRGSDACQLAVKWAVGIADQMAQPITIMPISAAEFVAEHGGQLAKLDPEQRERLRRVAAASMLDVLRDCQDPKVRRDALSLLHEMRTIQ